MALNVATRILTAALIIQCGVRLADAIEPMTLPDAPLRALDGGTVHSKDVQKDGHWLLIYVTPHSSTSQKLLGLFKHFTSKNIDGSKVIIVVGDASPEIAASLKNLFPELGSNSWYADPESAFQKSASLTESPIVLGFQDNTCSWSFSGLSSDLINVRSALLGWITEPIQNADKRNE